ncbi:MAG: alpha-1,2-fucosyltransferase [Synergistaceae bacterium]|nr:alpha-1,2-fucosyltransferase [Synergistaceae bacterium]
MPKNLRDFVRACNGVINMTMPGDGRLGNQMFQYAFGRALQHKFYPDYKLNLSYYEFRNKTQDEIDNGFGNTLKFFRLNNVSYVDIPYMSFMPMQNLVVFFIRCFNKLQRMFLNSRLEKFTLRLFNMAGLYKQIGFFQYNKPYSSFFNNITCRGYFQSHEYFDEIRDILLDEFTPKFDVLPHNRELLHDIEASESVCVTIRRGDYLSPQCIAKFNVCDESYFIKAMTEIRQEKPDCKFYIFSDDVDDIKRNFKFPYECVYELGNDPVWEKLRLMYSCKHFIISNSTFSWWAQYLSRNENKIVYAPHPWFFYGTDFSGIYTPHMRLIEIQKHERDQK